MSNLFRDWQKNVGRATLVLACAFAALWVRSLRVGDVVYSVEEGRFCKASSFAGFLELRTVNNYSVGAGITWNSYPLEEIPRQRSIDQLDSIRFGFKHHVLLIPYWLITVPLALFSAYLLFSKQRKMSRVPAVDPDTKQLEK